MNRKSLAALLVLNVALLAALAVLSFGPAAQAQQANRLRGNYLMTLGEIRGVTSTVVYIYDTKNRELLPVTFDGRKLKTLTTTREIGPDLDQAGQAPPR